MNARPRQLVIEALEHRGARRAGRDWTCPVHDDRRPSLSIGESSDGVALVHCQAGCATQDVVATLGLQMRDLFPDDDKAKARIEDARYAYTDERGEPMFEVVRFWPKGFAQRRGSGSGWTWNLNGVRRVPYRLPQVVEGVKAGRTIHVVEGERDVHAIERMGGIGTCNPGGVGKWRDDYAESLRGANVVVVADKDEAGRKHAQDVARSLAKVGARVQLVEAAAGKDAADHLAAGFGLEDFAAADLTMPEAGVRLVRASSVEPASPTWFWADRVPSGALTIIGGKPGLGKSTLLVELAARATRGQLAGDRHGTPTSVLIASAEDDPATTIMPRLLAAGADLERVFFVEVARDGVAGGITLPDDIDELAAQAEAVGAGLVVVDPLVAHLPGVVNSWRDQDVRRALAPLARMAQELRLAVAAVVHLNKASSTDALARLGGSVGFGAAARSVLLVAADPQAPEGSTRLLGHIKSNLAPEQSTLRFRVEGRVVSAGIRTSGIAWLGEADVDRSELLIEVDQEERDAVEDATGWLLAFLSGGPKSPEVVTRAALDAGFSERTLRRAKKRAGVDSAKRGFDGPWVWKLAEDDQGSISPTSGHLGGPGGSNPQVTANMANPADDGHLGGSVEGGQEDGQNLEDGHEGGQDVGGWPSSYLPATTTTTTTQDGQPPGDIESPAVRPNVEDVLSHLRSAGFPKLRVGRVTVGPGEASWGAYLARARIPLPELAALIEAALESGEGVG